MPDLLSHLSGHLRERSRVVGARGVHAAAGRCVVYWTHHALRVAENPALEVAASMAAERGLPLVVAAAVSAAHPILTDRHVRFFLEGVRELARALHARGAT